MAQVTIDSEDTGAYEVQLAPGMHTTFLFPGTGLNQPILLTYHSGESPLYYKTTAQQLEPKDPRQLMLPPGNDVPVRLSADADEAALTVVSVSGGIVSVAK